MRRTTAAAEAAPSAGAAHDGAPPLALAAALAAKVVTGDVTTSPTDWRSLYWNHSRVSIGGRTSGRPGRTKRGSGASLLR